MRGVMRFMNVKIDPALRAQVKIAAGVLDLTMQELVGRILSMGLDEAIEEGLDIPSREELSKQLAEA